MLRLHPKYRDIRETSHLVTVQLGILSALLLSSTTARADFFLHSWDDHYQPSGSIFFDAEASYYSSSENFDPSGNKFLPTTLNNYKRYEGDVLVAVGVTDRLSIFGRLSVEDVNLSTTNPYNGSASGLGDQSVGADLRLLEKPLSTSSKLPMTLDLQLQGDFPAYNNSTADLNLTPYLGDGTVDITGGAFVNVPVTQASNGVFRLSGGLGYEYRSNGYSAAVPWSILAKFERHHPGVIFNGGILGYQSLKTDSRGIVLSGASSLNTLSPGSGGSFVTSAINPSLIRLHAAVGYQFDGGSAILVAIDQAVWGQDAPYGTMGSVGFQAHFGEESSSSVSTSHIRSAGSDIKPLTQQGFVNYSMDAHVVKSNDRLNLVKIDKGEADGVAVGQVFDIYKPQADGSAGEAVARCQVVSVKSAEAAMNVIEYYKEIFIDEGFLAKRLIQN